MDESIVALNRAIIVAGGGSSERIVMKNYGIHRKSGDSAVYIVSGSVEGYSILMLVDEVDADTPLDAARAHIGEQKGKTLVIDNIEVLNDDVSKVSYHWHR